MSRPPIDRRLLLGVAAGAATTFLVSPLMGMARRAAHQQAMRRTQLFDWDWRFQRGEALGAEIATFNDIGSRHLAAARLGQRHVNGAPEGRLCN